MKKQYLPLLLALALSPGLAAQSRFDTRARMAVEQYMDFVREPGATVASFDNFPFEVNPLSRSTPSADIVAIVSEGVDTDQIADMGIEILSEIDNVIVGRGAIDDIIALAETDLVVQISFPTKLRPMLDKARTASNVTQVLNGTDGLQQAYDGEGVITAIFDIGMDPNHVNFKYEDGYTRLLNFWSYNASGRATQYGPGKISGFSTDDANETHGTHTMGCMAGSYKGTSTYGAILGSTSILQTDKPMPYYGMAPGASILAAAGPSYSSNILAALTAMSNRIKTEGLPGLLSLSFGSNLGPHDGTDPETMALNNLAKQTPFFIAAGNEGDMNMSLIGDFTAETPAYRTFLAPTGNRVGGEMEVWAATAEPLTITIGIFSRNEGEMLAEYDLSEIGSMTLTTSTSGPSSYIYDDDFAYCFDNSTVQVSSGVSTSNNRFNSVIKYNLTRKTLNASNRYVIAIMVKGQPGQHFDLVQKQNDGSGMSTAPMSSFNVEGYLDGGNGMSISNMACGPDMICIGAYNTRSSWGSLGGYPMGYSNPSANGYAVGHIAGYSSYGTLYNGTTLPVACAPGSGIISSVSQYWVPKQQGGSSYMVAEAPNGSKTSYWDAMQGTSMATPVAAGIAALWLQANPELGPSDIKQIIKETSMVDNYVTQTAENRRIAWGAGKIDALAGIKYAINFAGVSEVLVNKAKVVVINGIDGWQISVPGAPYVKVRLFDINGRLIVNTYTGGDSTELSSSSLASGIYILQVNDTHTQRLVVR